MTSDNLPPPLPPFEPSAAASRDYVGPPPTPDDCNMAMLCHLLGIFSGFLGPLIIWLIKKDQSPFVDDQGKEVLNFHITLVIGFIIGAVTWCLYIGVIIIAGLAISNIVFSILGTVSASKGIAYRYPLRIKFLK
jgi:uncharacterized Tic20 family protein